jgi:hypothetical protein
MGWLDTKSLELPFQGDSETSKSAAEKVEPNAAMLREQVYSFLKLQGIHGATDDEIQVGLKLHVSTQVPRRRELVLAGRVMENGFVRKTRKNCNATVWVASDVAAEHKGELGGRKSLKLKLKEAEAEIYKLKVEIERLHINTIIRVPAGQYMCFNCNTVSQHYAMLYTASGSIVCPMCKSHMAV